MGWAKLGNLTEYTKGDSIDRKAIQNQLKERYYQSDERLASRKAGEIVLYYKCESNTVFVVMDGERLIALADNVGAYYFNGDHGDENMPHQRTASWKFVFEPNAKMPEKSRSYRLTCALMNAQMRIFRRIPSFSTKKTLPAEGASEACGKGQEGFSSGR